MIFQCETSPSQLVVYFAGVGIRFKVKGGGYQIFTEGMFYTKPG